MLDIASERQLPAGGTVANAMAIALSERGATLMRRRRQGAWVEVVRVSIDAPDLPLQISRLRRAVYSRLPEGGPLTVWMPPEQIVEGSVGRDAADRSPGCTAHRLRAALAGETAFPPRDLLVVVGPAGPDGRVSGAVALAQSVSEARAHVTGWGLVPGSVTIRRLGEGDPAGVPAFVIPRRAALRNRALRGAGAVAALMACLLAGPAPVPDTGPIGVADRGATASMRAAPDAPVVSVALREAVAPADPEFSAALDTAKRPFAAKVRAGADADPAVVPARGAPEDRALPRVDGIDGPTALAALASELPPEPVATPPVVTSSDPTDTVVANAIVLPPSRPDWLGGSTGVAAPPTIEPAEPTVPALDDAADEPDPVPTITGAATATAPPPPRRPAGLADRAGIERVSLIGVFDVAAGREALLRLGSGDVRQVGTGETVEGWRVSEITPDGLRLSRGGRTRRLILDID